MTTTRLTPAAAERTLQKTRLALAAALLLSMAACGGGGDGSNPSTSSTGGTDPIVDAPPTASSHFSGTAAAGLPLVGSVTVKDAKGASKTVPLDNGTYSVDVTNMTGPFVFRAEGIVGGERYVIHSAATAADANGTINITPLTDLVVANIAGQLADKYFDSGNFSGLSKAELDSEASGLKAKLLPVLLALGVDGSIDLLRTSFTPLSSALDKALDVLRVSVDPATSVATITNIVTQQQITDDLAIKAAAETSATPLSGDGMGTAADDITLIRQALSDFTAKFANGSPAPAELLPLLTSTDPVTGTYNFRFADQSASQFTNEVVADANLVGASFTDVVIRKIDYVITASNSSPRAFVEFTHKDKNGVSFNRERNMQLVKGTDGKWRLRGDGRVLETITHIQAVKDEVAGCFTSGLQFSIEDLNTGNSASVAAVVVTGPGLPAAGLRHVRPSAGGYWPIEGNTGNLYSLASNCSGGPATAGLSDSDIAAIPDNAVYTLTALDANNSIAQIGGFDIVYKERVSGRPLTLAEATAAKYPAIMTSVPLASYTGGDITIAATGLNPAFAAEFYVGLTDNMLVTNSSQADVAPAADGTASRKLTVAAPANPIAGRYLFVSNLDANWRELSTRQRGQ